MGVQLQNLTSLLEVGVGFNLAFGAFDKIRRVVEDRAVNQSTDAIETLNISLAGKVPVGQFVGQVRKIQRETVRRHGLINASGPNIGLVTTAVFVLLLGAACTFSTLEAPSWTAIVLCLSTPLSLYIVLGRHLMVHARAVRDLNEVRKTATTVAEYPMEEKSIEDIEVQFRPKGRATAPPRSTTTSTPPPSTSPKTPRTRQQKAQPGRAGNPKKRPR